MSKSAVALFCLGFLVACDSGSTTSAPGTGGKVANSGGSAGAAPGTGGVTATGGAATGSGGAVGSGGAQASGGSSATGGSKATGGAPGSGGAKATGGNTTVGGTMASGGTAGGGVTSAGGATALGGATATGGKAGGATDSGGSLGGSTTTGPKATGGATGTGGSTATGANDLWLDPKGSDSNPGSEAQPLATLTGAQSKWTAGQTIWLKPGTYAWSATQKLTKAGSASSPINVFAAPGARPVIDFSAQPRDSSSARGIQISGSYWHLKGFDVMKAGDNCIHISGSNNTVEWVTVHECCDSGLQITDAAASNNTIVNCDSYGNYDTATGGENADGFAAKLELGPGNVFRGCRSWNNADDGWDLYAAASVVTIESSWAFLNGKLLSGGGTSDGDGNGFKLGGAGGGAAHKVTGCFAFENLACGFTRNNNTEVPTLSQCGGRSDGKGEYCSLSNPSPVSFSMTGSEAKAVQRGADGSLPAIK